MIGPHAKSICSLFVLKLAVSYSIVLRTWSATVATNSYPYHVSCAWSYLASNVFIFWFYVILPESSPSNRQPPLFSLESHRSQYRKFSGFSFINTVLATYTVLTWDRRTPRKRVIVSNSFMRRLAPILASLGMHFQQGGAYTPVIPKILDYYSSTFLLLAFQSRFFTV